MMRTRTIAITGFVLSVIISLSTTMSTLVQEVKNRPYTEATNRGRFSVSLTRLEHKLRRDGFCELRHDVLEIGFQLNFLL